MKRLLTIITVLAGIGLVGYYFFQKNGGLKDIEFVKLERIKIKKVIPFPKLSLTTSANAVLNNPNSFGVKITALDFDVYVEGKHTTTASQEVSIDMPSNAKFKLPINFDIPLGKTGFFNDAKDILTGAWKNKTINIRTVGDIHIKALTFDIKIPFDEEEAYLLKDYLPK